MTFPCRPACLSQPAGCDFPHCRREPKVPEITYPSPVCSERPGRCEVHGRHREDPPPSMDNLTLFDDEDE